MKRIVVVTLTIYTSDYDEVEDTPEGAVALVAAMLAHEADFPEEEIIISSRDENGSYEESIFLG